MLYILNNQQVRYYSVDTNYTLFYFDFISENVNGDEHFWSSQSSTSIHAGWAGRAFERVCMQHVAQIKAALGFSAVISSAHSWQYKGQKDPVTGKTIHKGAQIDLLIDRNDDTINLCEMKYSKGEYAIEKDESIKIRNRVEAFRKVIGEKRTIHVTIITANGLKRNCYWNDIQSEVTLDDLFKESRKRSDETEGRNE